MSSGFPREYFSGRSQRPYNSQLPELFSDPASQILNRLPIIPGKRSLAEFQAQQQQNQALSFYLRNVRARNHKNNNNSISPSILGYPVSRPNSDISPGLFNYSSLAPSFNNHDNGIMNINSNSIIMGNPFRSNEATTTATSTHFANYPGLVANLGIKQENNENMKNKLQELEKQLLLDDEEENDTNSVVTNSEWSDTFQNLIGTVQNSLSPTSSSSSCCSSSSSSNLSPKQTLVEAATAISDNKPELACEILARLSQGACPTGTAEQRLVNYFVAALRSRVGFTRPHAPEIFGDEHALSTQMLYEVSPCFKLGFMAANMAILDATSLDRKIHVVDFDIGRGGHYVHLIHSLVARNKGGMEQFVKITAVTEFGNEEIGRIKRVGDGLKALAMKVGISLTFNVLSIRVTDLSLERLGVEGDEKLAVNLSFKLYKLPDESVTTENPRDELLRRVKGLSPAVVAVVEQEMNANTAPFLARVSEACGYYGALFDSLDSTIPRDNLDRVRIEEGLGRKLANSVACDGRERVERCEVFGKWRARMGMAGFRPKPMARPIYESLLARLGPGARGNNNNGFTVKEENGGILFGWMGRPLTVSSAWQ